MNAICKLILIVVWFTGIIKSGGVFMGVLSFIIPPIGLFFGFKHWMIYFNII